MIASHWVKLRLNYFYAVILVELWGGGTASGHPSATICLSSLNVTLGIVKPVEQLEDFVKVSVSEGTEC